MTNPKSESDLEKQRMVDAISEKAGPIGPMGRDFMLCMAGALTFIFSHPITLGEKCTPPEPEEAVEMLDEFMLLWALRRVSSDPRFSIQPNLLEHIHDSRVLLMFDPESER